MMKKIIPIIIFNLFATCLFSQVGINTENPKTSLHVSVLKYDDPKFNEGVIIPRVKSLNTTGNKPVGLLVFLDYEDSNTIEIEKGFYWWNGTEWIPFFSMNKMLPDLTIAYVSSQNTFKEGSNITATSTDIRTISFNASSIRTNDKDNFSVENNTLKVSKAGLYHVQSTVSLSSTSNSEEEARDAYIATILVNGAKTTPEIRTVHGFPNGLSSTIDSSTTMSGYLNLKSGDKISIEIDRYYRDTDTTVTIKPNGATTNLILRLMKKS